MKKIILLILLIGIVYFVGTNLFDKNNLKDPLAQVFNENPNSTIQIEMLRKRISLSGKGETLQLIADFQVSAKADTTISVGLPKALKDGASFNISSSSPQFSGAKLKRIHVVGFAAQKSTVVSTSTLALKKGTSFYRFVWTVQKGNIPAGTYQMTFDTYSTNNSTTTYNLNTPWPKAVSVVPPLSTYLDGNHYKLVRFNNSDVATTSAPIIAFQEGKIRARFCNTLGGTYKIKKDWLFTNNLMGTMMACGNNKLTEMESIFSTQSPLGFYIDRNGEFLTLKTKRSSFQFIRYIPNQTTVLTGRVYPCNFVGPLQVGDTYDCNTSTVGNTILGTGLPMLTSISTTTARIGSSVSITGTNFATSNIVMFTPISSIAGTPTAIAQVATSSVSGITFAVPQSYICENGTTTCGTLLAIAPGIYRVQIKTPAGISPGSFTLVITQ